MGRGGLGQWRARAIDLAEPGSLVTPNDFDTALPMGRSCRSYRIGHRLHWIQGLRSAGATVVIRVSVAVHRSGLVQLRGDGLSLECWNHTPAAIQASLPRNPDHAVVWWKPEWHVAGA
jgi:hypothetical protein